MGLNELGSLGGLKGATNLCYIFGALDFAHFTGELDIYCSKERSLSVLSFDLKERKKKCYISITIPMLRAA